MAAFDMSTVIDRPVEDVFAVLADLANDPRWRREWVDARTTSQDLLGVGSRCCLAGQFLRWRTETEYEVTEYEPGRRAAWTTVRGPFPLTFFRSVEPADGGTKVTIGYDAQVHGLVKLLEPLFVMMGRRALAGDFPKLKELMEAHAL